MSLKNPVILLFIVCCIFQWYILSGWISGSERIIRQGQFVKIPCAQVDPTDPFRGAYLTVNPSPGQFEFFDSLQYSMGEDIWVNYACGDGDVCSFYSVQPIDQNPIQSVHLRCKITSIYPSRVDTLTPVHYIGQIEYPVARLYFNEKLADDINQKYSAALRDTSLQVLAGIYISENGDAVLEGIWIGDQRLTP